MEGRWGSRQVFMTIVSWATHVLWLSCHIREMQECFFVIQLEQIFKNDVWFELHSETRVHEREWLVIVDHLATVNRYSVLHTPPVTLWELYNWKRTRAFVLLRSGHLSLWPRLMMSPIHAPTESEYANAWFTGAYHSNRILSKTS